MGMEMDADILSAEIDALIEDFDLGAALDALDLETAAFLDSWPDIGDMFDGWPEAEEPEPGAAEPEPETVAPPAALIEALAKTRWGKCLRKK